MMNKIVQFLPGLSGAVCGSVLLQLVSWTRLTFEFVSFLLTCPAVSVQMGSAMLNYGNKL